jgi:hypothetical protein
LSLVERERRRQVAVGIDLRERPLLDDSFVAGQPAG